MNEYRYILEKSSKKHHCPDCNKKRFVRYIDTETGEYLPEKYGRCDRESKCGYFLNPYKDGYTKAIADHEQGNHSEFSNSWKPQSKVSICQQPEPEPVYFDFDTFKQTLQPERYEQNTFIQNLFHNVRYPFEADAVTKVIQLYRLGTVANGYRAGAITFPFMDIQGNIRAVQVKEFDKHNHTTGTDFLHSIIEKHHTRNNEPLPEWLETYKKQDKRISCLFGEHLLNRHPLNPVVLVEAPKTAIYGWLYFNESNTLLKDCVWLAVYNKSSFSFDKLKVLQGRFVYVFPDLSKDGNTFAEWETKAKEYESRLPGTQFIFSDLLEQLAPQQDKNEGKDIADFLIKQDWRDFKEVDQYARACEGKPDKILHILRAKEVDTKDHENTTQIGKIGKVKSKETGQIGHVKGYEESQWFGAFNQYTQESVNKECWNNDIKKLEVYFSKKELPQYPIRIKEGEAISGCGKFIKSHFRIIKANNGNNTFLPYLNRLKQLQKALNK